MPISLNFELNDRDLEHFHASLQQARQSAEGRSVDEVIAQAGKLLEDAQKVHIPDFIKQRLVRLDDMVAMLRDEAWAMEGEDRDRVLGALLYFANPKDMISDDVAVLGFLDDAVMIELCVRDLKHELDAYDDFCDFRQREANKRGVEPSTIGRSDWLAPRREELVDRMHERRGADREMGKGYGDSSGYASGSSYLAGAGRSYVRAWRPGMFRFR